MQSIKRNKLRDAIAIALVVGATGFASTSFAQDAAVEEKEVQNLDTMVVTGTRIQSQSVTASSPVYEIGADEFKYAGATRVDDLVNQFPQMSPYFDSFANNGAQGYPTADLRGLGTNRTLVLINGRRIQPGNGFAPDLSMIPSALIERVDLLTGGASAVYGADAVAGVVNFVLNSEFEGVSLNAGWSGYTHDNDNKYMQGLQDEAGYPYPTGNSGIGGQSYNVDVVVGSAFADGAGHASAYLTYRKNDALFQSERDESSCALGDYGTYCGGSATAGVPNFNIRAKPIGATANVGFAHRDTTTGKYVAGLGEIYNYAPINYYQRPEEKINFGANVKFEINEHAVPYLEMMFSERENAIQIAESGTFGRRVVLDCNSIQLNPGQIAGQGLCKDLNLDFTKPVDVGVNKRNIEGGPRHVDYEDSSYRTVAGIQGAINDNWTYDMSLLYGSTTSTSVGRNDFVSTRVSSALLGCPPGSFSGCEYYNVWVPGAVTVSAAQALAGTSFSKIDTTITAVNGYVQGDTGFGWVDGSNITLATGFDWLKQSYNSNYDSISQAGEFAGSGGPSRPLNGSTEVTEFFMEANVPVLGEMGFIDNVNLDLGYRYSDYNLSGPENTYKIALTSKMGWANFNGGYNRAIRAPNLNELFADQQVALFSGSDGCANAAGEIPTYTFAQCQLSGVTAAQYGNIAKNPAGQYNQFIGGNPDVTPEQADTWTFGFDFLPIEGLAIGIDYYDITIKNQIGTVGAPTILAGCAENGNLDLCKLIVRDEFGSIEVNNDNTAGFVTNLTNNFGQISTSGIDLSANYTWDWLDGRWMASFVGTYVLDFYNEPLKGVDASASYDCVGVVSPQCQLSEVRTITEVRYTNELFSVNARWRYISSLDYDNLGGPIDSLAVGGIPSVSFFDLSGSINVNEQISVTMGVNNIFDKSPPLAGTTLNQNGNFLGGYDAGGQYWFANLGVTF